MWIGSRDRPRDRPESDASSRELYYTVLAQGPRLQQQCGADLRALRKPTTAPSSKAIRPSGRASRRPSISSSARPREAGRCTAGPPRSAISCANGDAIAQEMIVARCTRGADIARSLRFPESGVRRHLPARRALGRIGPPGTPARRCDIPLYARIALLAQIADVFHGHAGRSGSDRRSRRRRLASGSTRTLVARIRARRREDRFWDALEFADAARSAGGRRWRQPTTPCAVDEDYLDAIAAAFGEVIDAKSPFTVGPFAPRRRLRRRDWTTNGRSMPAPCCARCAARPCFTMSASSASRARSSTSRPGSTIDEWVEMRDHAEHTRAILGRIGAFADFADLAAAHHERLDGTGYPRRT